MFSSESSITLNYVKYLPQFGWTPIVLCGKPSSLDTIDYSNMVDIPKNVKIYRTNSLFRVIIDFMSMGKSMLTHSNKHNKIESVESLQKNFNYGVVKLLRHIRILPSRVEGWLPFLVVAGIRIIKKDCPEIIISRSTPVTSHIGALVLKSLFGVPWIACYSDPWTTDPNLPYKNKIVPEKLLKQHDEYLERRIISKADKVIFTTNRLREEYVEKYSHIQKDKFAVIPNCYDPKQFSKVKIGKLKNNPFTITYAGTFSNTRSPEPLFKALKNLQNEGDFNINIKLIGGLGDFKHLLQEYELNDIVKVINKIPHKDTLLHLYSSDVLLLIDAPNHTMCLPSKLIEYIAIGIPILAITPQNGSSADVVRATKTGIVVPPNDPNAIKEAIKRYYIKYELGDLQEKSEWNEITKYNAVNCTDALVKLIDSVLIHH